MCTQLLPSNLYYDITENNIHPQDSLEYVHIYNIQFFALANSQFCQGKNQPITRVPLVRTCIVLYHTAQQHYSGVLPRSCLSQIHPYQFAQQASYTSVPVPHICSAVLHTLAAKG